jgi:excisionase family DNA binding protein
MDPKFVKLEEAAQQLNVSTDHLNALREEGKLRAYRDGASWKFRTEEIERMSSEGVPAIEAEESGINLDLDNLSLGDDRDLDDDSPADESLEVASGDDEPSELELAPEDSSPGDLQLADDDLDLTTGSSADLAIDLDDQASQPTKPEPAAESAAEPAESGLDLELEAESEGDDPESILLSEAELGDSPDRPPSTIIGKSELDDELDLEIAGDEPQSKSDPSMSDVQLADVDDLDSDAGATGELPASKDVTGDFDDIEELEIDLEAESSRILTPEDVAAAKSAAGAQAQQKAPETSDLDLDIDEDYGLAPSSSTGLTGLSGLDSDDDDDLIAGSEINLGEGSSKGSEAGLTGLSALELDTDDDDDDDFVLGDGSDLTLSSADSGINLSPADSGLSLDDAAVELTGSAIGSGIDFSDASGLVSDKPAGDFELTPLAEDAGGEEDDDSSQVIALDAFEEQQEADDLLGAGAGGGAAAMPAGASFGQGAVATRADAQFSGWNVFFLSLCLVLLSLCGMMALDVVRSMWSWDEPYQVNSSLIDSLSGFLFP